MPRVHYCTTVYDRWSTFQLLLDSFLRITAQSEHSTDRLCVYDWNGAGKDIYSTWPAQVSYQAGEENGPINRALARNRALACCPLAAADLVFFVDCDMVLPADFSARVGTHVRPGHAYFPVCYSLYQGAPLEELGDGPPYHKNGSTANGWWRDSGRGNCGFTLADFQTLGGWDSARFGARYGREDDDIYWRAYSLCEIHRERVHGFFHQWHPKLPEEQNPSVRK
jgi:hypothetical protein